MSDGAVRLRDALERHQVVLYLAAIAGGAALGLLVDGATVLQAAITPVLAALLYVTFLAVPVVRLPAAWADGRFLGALLAVNFVVVPAVVWLLTRPLADDRVLLVGVLLVLLTPCVDYVIVFTRLAGGAADRLLAAAPLLLIAQMLLLPVLLLLMVRPGVADVVEPAPFVEALVVLIVLPLLAAGLTQTLARTRPVVRRVESGAEALMVPLMMATLAVVVASQTPKVGGELGALVRVLPFYVVYVIAAGAVGLLVAWASRLDVGRSRALVLSAVTRNSLVVLPLALALPDVFALVPLVVVTQTLVELVVMVVAVRLVPRLVPGPASR